MSPSSDDDAGRLDRLRPTRRNFLKGLGVLGVGVVGTVSDAVPVYVVSEEDFETRKTRPFRQWTVRITRRYGDAEAAAVEIDGEVATAADLRTPVAELVRSAARSSRRGIHRDVLPDGTRAAIDRYAGFAVSGDQGTEAVSLALFRNHPHRPPRLVVDAELVDDRAGLGNPAAVELSVRNRGKRSRTIVTGVDPPFGDVYAEPRGGGRRVRLWPRGDPPWHLLPGSMGVPAVAVHEPIAAGERLRTRYRLPASDLDLAAGEYLLRGSTGSYPGDPDQRPRPPGELVEWSLRFRIEYGP